MPPIKNLSNKKFGYLTPIKVIGRKKNRALWQCICVCGKEFLTTSLLLTSGHTKSCGCKTKHLQKKSGIKFHKTHNMKFTNHPGWQGYGEISLTYFNAIKYGAIKRKFEFTISIKDIWNLFLSQNRKCALSGLPLSTFRLEKKKNLGNASLDRIDSSKGYVKGNIQWVHKDINKMKMKMSNNTLIKYCKLISKHN